MNLAFFTDNRPAGKALLAVLGFSESNLRSTSLLKPIAKLRAKIMAETTSKIFVFDISVAAEA